MEHGLLTLRARGAAPVPESGWLDVPGRMALPDGRVLAARLLPAPEATDVPALARSHGLEWEGQSVLLDAQAAGVDASLGGRLWVDVPHPGDVMCPLGMHGQSKKLSDLMGEAHVPVAERAAQPWCTPLPPARWCGWRAFARTSACAAPRQPDSC